MPLVKNAMLFVCNFCNNLAWDHPILSGAFYSINSTRRAKFLLQWKHGIISTKLDCSLYCTL